MIFFNHKKLTKIAKISFELGILFLLAVPILSGLFLLFSFVVSIFNIKENYFTNKWNKYFFISSIFLLFSTTINIIFRNEYLLENWDPNIYWINLFNWIPFFFIFWIFKPYLKNVISRKRVIYILLVGSIPLIITGIGQYFLKWHGPIILFNGLLTWFQRPIGSYGGLTGLFNNENYAAIWLAIIWPLSLACILNKKLSLFQKFLVYSFIILIAFTAILTRSRIVRFELLVSYILTFLNHIQILLIPIYLIFIIFLAIKLYPNIGLSFQFDKSIIALFKKINIMDFEKFLKNIQNIDRINIWMQTINLIIKRPFIGWGAATFPYLFYHKDKAYFSHTHNIFFEIAYSYGLIPAILISIPIISILIISFNKLFINKNTSKNHELRLEKSWWIATFTIVVSHLVDIQYYDFRISFIFWIFLSGLSNIIEEY